MSQYDKLALPRASTEYVKRYEDADTWRDETILDHLDRAATDHPKARIVGPNGTTTYEELRDAVDRVSAGLQDLGVSTGDVVSYQLPNRIETVVVHLSISRLGAIANPIIPIYRHSEVEYILNDAESSVVVVPGADGDFDYPSMIGDITADCPDLETVVVVDGDAPSSVGGLEVARYATLADADPATLEPPAVDANDLHALIYTSGTTSDPKGVLHTHNTLLYEERVTADMLGLSGETTVFMASPITHITGVVYALEMPFLRGMDLVVMNEWDPGEAVELIDEYECNFTVAATPFLQGIHDAAPDDWDNSLRVFGCGGADVPPELVRKATKKLNCTVQRVYGSTEYPTATWPPLDASLEKLAETDGSPAPGVHLKIVDLDSGKELPPGETGEILVHGPELMIGYADEALTEDAFDGDWFRTGDLGALDEDGYLEVTGRKKDIIVRGGENIPVKDVEDRLYEHPSVRDVAVVAMPDEELQEKGCAYVQVVEGEEFTFGDMTDWLDDQQIARQKYPERLEVVEAFPTTASGKIQKSELRERIAEEVGMDPIKRK
jgi:cyclohexanecarboxylate-CoA ligase